MDLKPSSVTYTPVNRPIMIDEFLQIGKLVTFELRFPLRLSKVRLNDSFPGGKVLTLLKKIFQEVEYNYIHKMNIIGICFRIVTLGSFLRLPKIFSNSQILPHEQARR